MSILSWCSLLPSLPLPTGVQGLNYPSGETFTASGGTGTGYTWSIVAGNPLPTGLALSSAAGTTTSITAGPPTAAGTYPFSVKLTDSVGNTATTSSLNITINPPIGVTFSPTQPFAMDQNTTQLVTASVNNDPGSAGVTWSSLTGLGSLTAFDVHHDHVQRAGYDNHYEHCHIYGNFGYRSNQIRHVLRLSGAAAGDRDAHFSHWNG